MKTNKILFIILSVLLVFSLVGCGAENSSNYNLKENVEKELSTLFSQMVGVESFELADNLTTLTIYVDNGFFTSETLSEKIKLLNLLDQALTKTIQVEDIDYPVDNIQIYIKRNEALETIAHYDNGLVDIK